MFIIGSLLGTIAGIVMGVRLANKVPIPQLKMMIAIITILSSLYMLVMLNIRA